METNLDRGGGGVPEAARDLPMRDGNSPQGPGRAVKERARDLPMRDGNYAATTGMSQWSSMPAIFL